MTSNELEGVLRSGEEPRLDGDVVGWEFEGWNVSPLAALIAIRKFKKGLFRDAQAHDDPARPQAWGYNMTVQQNAFDDPWIPTPSPASPNRHYFFGVLPSARASSPRHPGTLVLDYRLWKESPRVNPMRYTVDYLVYPNAGDKSLLLGKSYAEPGTVDVSQGFFLLRRDPQRSGYKP